MKEEAILSDVESYEVVDISPETLSKRLVNALKNMKSVKNLPANIRNSFLPTKETRLSEFYGLPKNHKENAPLRPVVAAFDGPMTPISIFLERILHQLLQFVPAHIQDTTASTRRLKKLLPSLGTTERVI